MDLLIFPDVDILKLINNVSNVIGNYDWNIYRRNIGSTISNTS
jgi:hypothetical protein